MCPVEEFSPPWKSCGYPNPKTVAAVFENHLEPGELRGQVTTCKSTVTVITLSNLRHIYAIPNEYVILCPNPDERVCFPPPSCYSIHEEHLKSGITFPTLPLSDRGS